MATRPRSRVRAPPVRNIRHAEQEEDRRKARDVEGQRLHDQRRSDIGAEHHGERRNERDEAGAGEGRDHQAGRGAALQDGRHPEARRGGLDPVVQRTGEETSEVGAEGALHAALHHVDGPQQQCDRAGKIEKAERRVHQSLLRRERIDRRRLR